MTPLMTLNNTRNSICSCVFLLLLVKIIHSEGHTIRRAPPGCYRSLRHCKAKCCGSGKFCDSVMIRGCTWYSCVSADCAALHDPTNGKVNTTMGTSLESLATYICNDGYVLSHTGMRVCLSSGQWSDTAPTCEPFAPPFSAADCNTLLDPTNGKVSTSMGTRHESLATYTCNEGYVLSHTGKIVCLSSGQWSDTAPTCLPVDCDPLDPPCAGSVNAPNTTVGSIATYSCDPGLSLTGNVTRTCQSNGRWSGSVPCCEDRCSQLVGYDFRLFSSYYRLVEDKKTFENAQNDCLSDGANLVKIDSFQKQQFLDAIGANDENDWWIGLRRPRGPWYWISDGTLLGVITNWAPGYPSSNLCTATNDGRWYDRPCNAIYRYICELECGGET